MTAGSRHPAHCGRQLLPSILISEMCRLLFTTRDSQNANGTLVKPRVDGARYGTYLATVREPRTVSWEAGAGWHVPYGDRVRLNKY